MPIAGAQAAPNGAATTTQAGAAEPGEAAEAADGEGDPAEALDDVGGAGGEPGGDDAKADVVGEGEPGGEPGEVEAGAGGDDPNAQDGKKAEPLDEAALKRRMRRLEQSHAALTDKKRAFKEWRDGERQKIVGDRETVVADRQKLDADRATFEKEHANVKRWVQDHAEHFKTLDSIKALAARNDAGLVKALAQFGFDFEKFSVNVIETDTPVGEAKRANAKYEELQAQIAADRKARDEAEERRKADDEERRKADEEAQKKAAEEAKAEREAEMRHKHSVAVLALTKKLSDSYPLAGVAAEENPREVVALAWKLFDEHGKTFMKLDGEERGEAILAEIEAYYDDQAKKAEARRAKAQKRREPSIEQRAPAAPAVAKPATGLPIETRRAPASTTKSLEDMSDEERTRLSVQRVRQRLRSPEQGA